MRIVYIHQYFCTPNMAGGTRSYEMARRLVQMGHKVTIITSDRDQKNSNNKSKLWRESTVDGIRVWWCNVPYANSMSFVNRIKSFLYFMFFSTSRVCRTNADVIYATSTPLTIAVPGLVGSLIRRTPFVFEVRDLWPEVPIAMKELKNPILIFLARLLEKIAYKRASAIVALSPDMKKKIVFGGISQNKVTVIPNGCDRFAITDSQRAESQKQISLLGNKKFIIYTGTLGRVNASVYLCNLAVFLKRIKSEFCVVIIGSGSERSQLVEESKRQGVWNDNFFMFDQVSKSLIPALIERASAGISTVKNIKELHANSANKIFDYMAVGRPILINHGGWLADMIEKEKCGYVLGPDLTMEEIVKLEKWLSSEEETHESGKNALRSAEHVFSRDQQASDLESVLRKVIESS